MNRFTDLTELEVEILSEAVAAWLDGAIGIEPERYTRGAPVAGALLEELENSYT